MIDSVADATKWSRRTRSWSPHSLADACTELGFRSGDDDEDSDDAPVLFDSCRFPKAAHDLLDCIIRDEPWQEVETVDGRKVRFVGEAGALKKLFSIPTSDDTDAISIHRLGDSLVVLDTSEEPRIGTGVQEAAGGGQVFSTASSVCSTSAIPRCQVHVEGDMVRVYPRIETAEPVSIGASPPTAEPVSASCEWRVREGLSLLAVGAPRDLSPGGTCGLMDLQSSSPRFLSANAWSGTTSSSNGPGSLDVLHACRPALPAYHKQVTNDQVVVLAVNVSDPVVATATLLDAWLSCCLMGSPSLLCFFVDRLGVHRGCRFVAAAEIPLLSHIAEAYRGDQRCLADSSPARTAKVHNSGAPNGAELRDGLGVQAFDPKSIREMSHALLETLVDRCDRDGGHCVVFPGPLGLRLFRARTHSGDEEDDDDDEIRDIGSLALALRPNDQQLPFFRNVDSATPGTSASGTSFPKDRLQRAHVTQALLMYHAAVRLAQPRRPTTGGSDGCPDTIKDVPIGSRWTAKSCRHPLRVRKMMLRAVRALRTAIAVGRAEEATSDAGRSDQPEAGADRSGSVQKRFPLMLASAFEFLADTFLAENPHGEGSLDVSRYLAVVHHLKRSVQYLAEYKAIAFTGEENNDFAQSVKRLEERVLAKRTNAHLCLARLRQRQPWREGESLCAVGLAMHELDAAEVLISQPSACSIGQQQRALGPYECSVLASISKWKADLLYELAALAMPGPGQVEPNVREYLEEQQRETKESPQPLPAQCERWLQSTVSLSLRGLHQLNTLPNDIAGELQVQARVLLARAYGDLGHIYASTGRYTKAMTHAKQGIELFTATKDKFQAAKLQLWLSRIQLRLAVPPAAPSGPTLCAGLDDQALLRGFSAAGGAEDAACAQVVDSLQRALKNLVGNDAPSADSMEEESKATYATISEKMIVDQDGKALLGRVLLRRGLTRLARSSPFGAVCRFCEDDSALPSALELLQVNDSPALDNVREAVEFMQQASAYFQETGSAQLSGIASACLAAVYFLCGRQDNRVHKLALTHCQHALDHLRLDRLDQDFAQSFDGDARESKESVVRSSSLRVAVQLIEAKALRRANTKGEPSRTGDSRSVIVLCDVALQCCQARSSGLLCITERLVAGSADDDSRQSTQMLEEKKEEDRLRTAVLAGDEQSLPLMSYIRQELRDILLRLLKINERQDGKGRDLKALYCSLLTSWHNDTGQAEALTALREHVMSIVALAVA